ncbi:TadA family conjugal transfer-associated ATPase [Plantibacter sp. VKM Ac-2885]|uniref:TadA family conjugal transfer-associated ATPase n=1 Tax=Plantibacter sp. VKM Ac-2885 TaxID=2783828 RepID=UPI00188D7D27|nr:TadA family conjugal transfer-associated ATPase [Plantibacter sp. VKM Ac-2885]MBF4514027.1 TadA family conjugal transfer-associated ATPase [Plantibacter sp. VKM Ac-2885]
MSDRFVVSVPPEATPPDPPGAAADAESARAGESRGVTALADFGALAPYLADPGVTDLFVNGSSGLWLDHGAGLVREAGWRSDEATIRALAVRLVARGGRHVDEATPCVDVRLQDGVRVHVVLPPVSTRGTLLSIRVPRDEALGFDALQAAGMFPATVAELLRDAVAARTNILITGAGGSGKTTLLGALLGLASPAERLVVIEDVAELRILHPHVVALQSRQANLEGAGGIDLERLLREALRMRPDRLVLGECRGPEVRELLSALNTGHDGGAGTLHANSVTDVPARLEALGALAGMSQEAVARQATSAIGLVVHLARLPVGRQVVAVGRLLIDEHDRLSVEELP